MGRVVAPYGIKGWIRIQPFTQEFGGLLDYAQWQVGREGAWRQLKVESARVHGSAVVAKLEGVADRDQAAALQGLRIAVPRDAFPEPADGEYYWTDLIGLRVVNAEGIDLGTVVRVFDTGANDVLVLEGDRERLLPFTGQVIRRVDCGAGTISVDWGVDY